MKCKSLTKQTQYFGIRSARNVFVCLWGTRPQSYLQHNCTTALRPHHNSTTTLAPHSTIGSRGLLVLATPVKLAGLMHPSHTPTGASIDISKKKPILCGCHGCYGARRLHAIDLNPINLQALQALQPSERSRPYHLVKPKVRRLLWV